MVVAAGAAHKLVGLDFRDSAAVRRIGWKRDDERSGIIMLLSMLSFY